MTQHEELIEKLRAGAGDPMSADWSYTSKATLKNAVDLIESQSREIAALKEQEAELCTLYGLAEAECKRLRVKAARYDWLRQGDNDEKVLCNGPVAKDYWYLPRNEKLDAAIDAAMAKDVAIAAKGV